MLEQAAAGDGFRGIDRILANVDVLYDALFVDDKSRTLSQFVARSTNLLQPNRNPKLFENLQVRIAQEWKTEAELLRVGSVRCRAVTTDSENHRVACIQLWPISLIGFEFTASSFGKCEHVEDENDVLLASKIAELDLFPVIAEEREIRSLVSWPQDPHGRGLSESRRRESCGEQDHCPDEHSKSLHRDLS